MARSPGTKPSVEKMGLIMRKYLGIAALLFIGVQAGAATNFAGYLKTYAIGTDGFYQSQSAARVMWDVFGDGYALQLHYELTPVFNSDPLPFADPTLASTNQWRLTDIDRTLSDDPRRQLLQNLDRLNVQFMFDAGNLTIGRQPITFGMARIINPTDVFLPFDVRAFNTEYRVGVDGIRFQHPFGQLGEFDTGIILGSDASADDSGAFIQVRNNLDGRDYQFSVLQYARQSLVGVGMQSAIGDFGFWLEAAYTNGDVDFGRLSTGFDYAFTEFTFGQVEYHFNGAGSDNPAEYLTNLGTTPYRVGGVFLLGKHYLIPSLSIQLSPLWTMGLQAIVNLSDQSAFASIAINYSASDNVYLGLGYYHFLGNEASTPASLSSEYGDNPKTLYASLRYYF